MNTVATAGAAAAVKTAFDRQGALGEDARVDRAMAGFACDFGALSALRLESCIHCGMCADACHFYIATEDPQYTPIWKVEPFKQAYKRESGPFAPLFRLFGFKRKLTADELGQWQHLLFDSCNLCGRCSLICPMGIDVAALIEQARHAMFEAGLAPKELYEKAAHQKRTGQPEDSAEPYRDKLLAIGRSHGVDIPLDKPEADVMLTVPRTDIEHYPEAVAALARVMSHMNVSCTFRSDGLVAENYAYYAGGREWQRDISRRLIEQALACKVKVLIVPECGHAYSALRWEAAELYGRPLPFKVRHITEYLAAQLDAGKLRLRQAANGVSTFHDPCQLVRKGGVTESPRKLLRAMGVELRELDDHGAFAFCCGGGGGVLDIQRAAPLRYRAMESKLREVDQTGAQTFLTSCSDCRRTFDDGKRHFNWDKTPQSLLELIADHLGSAQEARS
ncbi:MAG: (Fe-S)-binding protein [Gammaproteobacteria bacterium]|nr:(Fe-S)-binding protein [Gammaproteobacteria bacterium]